MAIRMKRIYLDQNIWIEFYLDPHTMMLRLRNRGINLLGAHNSALRTSLPRYSLRWSRICWATATTAPNTTPNWRLNRGRGATRADQNGFALASGRGPH